MLPLFLRLIMKNISEKLQNVYIVWLAAIICCFLWGSAFPVIKIGYKLFNIDSSDTALIILFAGIRFILAGILTITIFSFANKKFVKPKKSSLGKVCVLALFQTILQYLFFYIGLAHTTGVKSSIIDGTSTFFAILISIFIFKQEQFSFAKIVGSLLGFSGVFLAGLSGNRGGLSFQLGDFLLLISALSYACSSVFMKKYSNDDNPAVLSGYQFVLGGLVMSVVGLLMGGKISTNDVKGILVLIYLGFISAIAYSLWGVLLKYNDVSRITVCGSMTPIFGFTLSYLLLGEDNGKIFYKLIGLLCVVCGMVIVNLKSLKMKKTS